MILKIQLFKLSNLFRVAANMLIENDNYDDDDSVVSRDSIIFLLAN